MFRNHFDSVESVKVMGSASKQMLGPNIKVLLWNVFKCKRKGWQGDFKALSSDKDIILLQEAIVNSPFDSVFKMSLQHQWIMACSFRSTKTNIETGVKTGAAVAAKKHSFTVSQYSEPITKTKKMLLATTYPLIMPGEWLLVVNVHIINFVSFNKFCAHIDQVFTALEYHNGPLIVAGDFNTWNSKRFRYFNQLASLFSLKEMKIKRRPRIGHLFKHLDHIYYRELQVVDAQVHTHIYSSDHHPISATFRTLSSIG